MDIIFASLKFEVYLKRQVVTICNDRDYVIGIIEVAKSWQLLVSVAIMIGKYPGLGLGKGIASIQL